MCIYIESNHADKKQTIRSSVGFMINFKMLLMNLYLKRQPTIQTSLKGAAFIAMKVAVKLFHEI